MKKPALIIAILIIISISIYIFPQEIIVLFEMPVLPNILQFVILMLGVIVLLDKLFSDRYERRIRNNKRMVEDMQNWVSKSSYLMADFEIRDGKLRCRDSRDPTELNYPEETKIHLKAYNALDLWEKAKTDSQSLKDKGVDVFSQFDRAVNDIISDLKLAKSGVKISHYNLANIKNSVFVEIRCRLRGKKAYGQFRVSPEGENYSLTWNRGTRLARGNQKLLNILKNRIENLINSGELQEIIRCCEVIASKINENDALVKFTKKVVYEIIKPFNMGKTLKGKCRFC